TICHIQISKTHGILKTCEENSCYKMSVRGWIIGRGCGCPSAVRPRQVQCCTSDKCNY
uniref:Dendroaspis polylepis MT9 n=1 Tax=Dendroaspis polylepis polylepis TaxID=8620 RepID=3SX9_DENPO|nr:RecName: Full=Dendroaspis polylepis MT9; AltName: Full=Three-finger toxin; Short=3FTx [Dendroaspis polylepis polylepis]6R5M_A Chain A, Dendroaspis polylepis MT9 [Dendroaspis polylepis]6R5M_B Chain B, Dendroaspis polylepis MT9 [Dendroaspis polylepis]6R5M_C Chain C, Dendroaspis polylepis MT9 [Dendroaspis polylepis]